MARSRLERALQKRAKRQKGAGAANPGQPFESARYSIGSNLAVPDLSKKPAAKLSSWKNRVSINNIEQEKRKKVEKVIKEREELKLKLKKRASKKRAIILALPIILFWVALSTLSNRYSLAISTPGPSDQYMASLNNQASRAMLPGGVEYLKYVIPSFLRGGKIEESLLRGHGEIESVKYRFNPLKLKSEIALLNKIPILKWQVSGERALYVDRYGRIFEPSSPAYLQGFQIVSINGTGLEFDAQNPDLPVIGLDRLTFIAAAVPLIQDSGLSVGNVSINGQKFKEVEVSIGPKNTKVILSADEDAGRSAASAVKAYNYLESHAPGGISGVEYIDSSSPDKATYKLKA